MVMKDKGIDKATKKAFKVLKRAEKFAEEHRDIEALIAIADRWAILSERLVGDHEDTDFSIGFVSQESNGRVDESGRKKARDKRKG